jgi:hypothetical protein
MWHEGDDSPHSRLEAQLASLRRENEALEKALKEIASGDWNEDGMCEVAIRALAARGGGEGR